ncbi:MAG TPA: sigma-70 family RNA polymerase sigma factor [Eggerthellaceae bacterium]|nr:sigma-70 family RNA polymerase sigma factor [Eggerthellaceae bacterium]
MRRGDDESLFEQLVAGDQDCLRPLMERYGDALTLYVNGYVRDVDAAEDIMIEAFSRMLAKRPRLHAGGFKPYLYKTARNLALRHIRVRNRFMGLDDLGAEPAGGEHAEDELLRDERARALYRCLANIAPDYREALYLVYIEGMSYDEAGAVMRKTRKQVDNLVQRGKSAMRPLLAEEGVTYEVD